MMIFSNLKQIVLNQANSFIHNPKMLKTESLVLASLVLMVSRILVANVSAIQAEDTPQEAYRRKESYRTTTREVGGFILSFLVLRQLQKLTQTILKRPLGMRVVGKPAQYDTPWKDLRSTLIHKKGYRVNPFEPTLTAEERWEYHPTDKSQKLHGFISQNPLLKPIRMMLPKNEAGMMTQLIRFLPIGIASIPAVLLSGAVLERYTRDHCGQDAGIDSPEPNPNFRGQTIPVSPQSLSTWSLPLSSLAAYPLRPLPLPSGVASSSITFAPLSSLPTLSL